MTTYIFMLIIGIQIQKKLRKKYIGKELPEPFKFK